MRARAPVVAMTEPRRNKVPLEKGFSQVDWLRLKQRLPPSRSRLHRQVSAAELRRHQSPDDAWTAVRGVVYNITPYLRFHPGGAEVLLDSAAGRDATALFDRYHAWVNIDFMLDKCCVGVLVAGEA